MVSKHKWASTQCLDRLTVAAILALRTIMQTLQQLRDNIQGLGLGLGLGYGLGFQVRVKVQAAHRKLQHTASSATPAGCTIGAHCTHLEHCLHTCVTNSASGLLAHVGPRFRATIGVRGAARECMCVCACVYICVWVCACVCVYVCACVRMSVCVCQCVCVHGIQAHQIEAAIWTRALSTPLIISKLWGTCCHFRAPPLT